MPLKPKRNISTIAMRNMRAARIKTLKKQNILLRQRAIELTKRHPISSQKAGSIPHKALTKIQLDIFKTKDRIAQLRTIKKKN